MPSVNGSIPCLRTSRGWAPRPTCPPGPEDSLARLLSTNFTRRNPLVGQGSPACDPWLSRQFPSELPTEPEREANERIGGGGWPEGRADRRPWRARRTRILRKDEKRAGRWARGVQRRAASFGQWLQAAQDFVRQRAGSCREVLSPSHTLEGFVHSTGVAARPKLGYATPDSVRRRPSQEGVCARALDAGGILRGEGEKR